MACGDKIMSVTCITLGVHVQRQDELAEGTGAHECFARFADILAAIFLQVTLGVESSIEARRATMPLPAWMGSISPPRTASVRCGRLSAAAEAKTSKSLYIFVYLRGG